MANLALVVTRDILDNVYIICLSIIIAKYLVITKPDRSIIALFSDILQPTMPSKFSAILS